MPNFKNILVVAAHPDDEVLGCGGTLYKLRKKGAKITTLFLSDGESSRKKPKISKLIQDRKKQAFKAGKIIGIKKIIFGDFPDNSMDSIPILKVIQFIERQIKIIKPDTIFTTPFGIPVFSISFANSNNVAGANSDDLIIIVFPIARAGANFTAVSNI